jgi:tetratricopeptide (TPR) repeat protein
VQNRLGDAAAAFQDERFDDVRKILAPIVERHPSVPELHELHGLALYRLGRWRPAKRELEAFAMMTGSTEQHPIRADIARALGRHAEVCDLWEELRHDDPDADVMTEGRIVLAGSHADQGDLAGAIRVLEQGPMKAKKPSDHHLRLWYSLADMYERAGDMPRARRGFERVSTHDRQFADVAERLSALG